MKKNLVTRNFGFQVHVTAPARLHLGFMDLNGGLGRRFGSLGLTVNELATELSIEPGEGLVVEGPQMRRVTDFIRLMQQQFGFTADLHVTVLRAIPEHIGLGSGTQLALATGMAVSRFYDLGLAPRDVASLLDRGGRSGIGIGAFESGGFLVDGGRGTVEGPPRVTARLAFPDAWRIVLVFDRRGQGVHGSQETTAFQQLPPFPAEKAAHLCRLVLMQTLPALLEEEITAFGRAVTELQCTVGDHFAPAQGGRFASSEVASVLDWFQAEGITGVGQSSWGPTGFAIVDSEIRARQLVNAAQARWGAHGYLNFMICTGNNSGGYIREFGGAVLKAASL